MFKYVILTTTYPYLLDKYANDGYTSAKTILADDQPAAISEFVRQVGKVALGCSPRNLYTLFQELPDGGLKKLQVFKFKHTIELVNIDEEQA